ncbi:P-loop containing nucleoside triphosphate hydrolase protein [Aulographum hederae CBS 113979]|uniref:P-loop containing nucleoside triphosphate hydrolase protein n=1 Tax=Aulographum hederae CBS 113979 TaxID=1176131 RepID=A0A6G1GXI1_9PEZI|nr:P-loop containing nucleoside triphosphate hydrolase protein [Aulographum hederae CBS 113979]
MASSGPGNPQYNYYYDPVEPGMPEEQPGPRAAPARSAKSPAVPPQAAESPQSPLKADAGCASPQQPTTSRADTITPTSSPTELNRADASRMAPPSSQMNAQWNVAGKGTGQASNQKNKAGHSQPNRADAEEEQEYNSHIQELQGRTAKAQSSQHIPTGAIRLGNSEVSKYFVSAAQPIKAGPWISMPEIPTAAEILDHNEEGRRRTTDDPPASLEVNRVDGPWPSKETYLSSHYQLLRDDAIRPLRDAVQKVFEYPEEQEACFAGSIGIYTKVFVTAVTLANRGIGVRVTFSLARAGVRVRWEQSKRLISGSLVALTPATDMFKTSCTMAVVAARPLDGLNQDPPEIDLFFARAEEIEIDPAKEWVMVEDRSGYFEAERHTLLALQKVMRETFPLQEQLVDVETAVEAPLYVQAKPATDMSVTFESEATEFQNMNILEEWQKDAPQLDASQLSALKRILTKRLAIVQGPPGTGKTHVSIQALKVMLANMVDGDPPIVVTCQTNHALDQFLRLVAEFEPSFVRLGGRTKDNGIIKRRTLFEVRQESGVHSKVVGGKKRPAMAEMKRLSSSMTSLLSPMTKGEFFKLEALERLNLLTPEQAQSIAEGDKEWVTHDSKDVDPLLTWGRAKLDTTPKYQKDDFGFAFEEVEDDYEELIEAEAEAVAQDDDDIEALKGVAIGIAEHYVPQKVIPMTEQEIEALLKKNSNMWRIPGNKRSAVFQRLQEKGKALIVQSFRRYAMRYMELTDNRRIGAWEEDTLVLKEQRVIGMTTTGLSKYRALVSSVKPKVVLIEEAAETLEAPVVAACMESLEHLILVGDHQQLRPHCHVKEYEDSPFFLNVSLFERMVKNDVEMSMLKRQRRMIPEIRRLLKPIYGNLIKDHMTVKDLEKRPPIHGMGRINSYFFTHIWPEEQDAQMSSFNRMEAEMVVNMFDYLVLNGEEARKITVVTFYQGQRKAILKGLRAHLNFRGQSVFHVVTVDSYQGEENDIILLSLVRSNDYDKIGFLSVDNRVCVALSRAKRGLYIFGNGELLAKVSPTWSEVCGIMEGPPAKAEDRRIGYRIPVVCQIHGKKTWLGEPDDFSNINGGCSEPCREILPCGHSCQLRCHPFEGARVNCKVKPCGRALSCGHECQEECCNKCECLLCPKNKKHPADLAGDDSSEDELDTKHFQRALTLDPPSHSGFTNVGFRRATANLDPSPGANSSVLNPHRQRASPASSSSNPTINQRRNHASPTRAIVTTADWQHFANGGHHAHDKAISDENIVKNRKAAEKAMLAASASRSSNSNLASPKPKLVASKLTPGGVTRNTYVSHYPPPRPMAVLAPLAAGQTQPRSRPSSSSHTVRPSSSPPTDTTNMDPFAAGAEKPTSLHNREKPTKDKKQDLLIDFD